MSRHATRAESGADLPAVVRVRRREGRRWPVVIEFDNGARIGYREADGDGIEEA